MLKFCSTYETLKSTLMSCVNFPVAFLYFDENVSLKHIKITRSHFNHISFWATKISFEGRPADVGSR